MENEFTQVLGKKFMNPAKFAVEIEKLVKSMGEHRREDITTAVRALDAADKQLEKTKQLEEM